ncbi:hypothetical protein D3C72_96450 [compost metagenome]
MMTYLEAAHLILAEAGSALSEEEMVARAIAKGLIKPSGKSPVKSIGVVLRRASQNPSSAFENAGPRLWQLKDSETDQPLSMREAAHQILKKAGRPLHYREITRRAIRLGMIRPEGRTPALTLRARMGDDMNRNPETPFVRVGDGTYALKEWPLTPKAPAKKRQDCACCGFSPRKAYGDLGEDALVKHKEAGFKDAVLVCGNCQIMLKRTTMAELKTLVAEFKKPALKATPVRKPRAAKAAKTR